LLLQRRIGNARTAALLGGPAAAPAVQRTPRPTLQWGSEGTHVMELQEALNRKARLLPLKVSGFFDHATRAAVVALQQHHLIDVDGVVGPQTWEALAVTGAQPVLRVGDDGPAVAELQRGLNGQAVEIFLEVDGQYGPLTYAVTRAFQQRQGLAAHGTVGAATWNAQDVAAEDSDKLAQPDIAATDKAAAKYLLRQLDKANDRSDLTAGVWYAAEYYHATHADPATESFWRDEYVGGYADPAFFERQGYMDWTLKPGTSASEAIRAWLSGLTIAECLTTIVAAQWETLRAMIGDETFDREFGSSDPVLDAAVAEEQRLRVRNGWLPKRSPGGGGVPESPLLEFLRKPATGAGTLGNRPVQPGERYYFGNHFKFKHKHPDPTNNLVGENALFVGWEERPEGAVQEWNGLGMPRATELEILDTLAAAWNEPRTEGDYQFLLLDALGPERVRELVQEEPDATFEEHYEANLDDLPDHYNEDVDPELQGTGTLTGADLAALPPGYDAVSKRERTPGFNPESGIAFDVDKVRALRGFP
jgi:peptidoglycan hydrolase-like protein with peptidoglycan-binding domain